jgi:hypothetical protein
MTDDLISRQAALTLFEANENIPTQSVRSLISALPAALRLPEVAAMQADIADLQDGLARYMTIAGDESERADRAVADKAAAVEACCEAAEKVGTRKETIRVGDMYAADGYIEQEYRVEGLDEIIASIRALAPETAALTAHNRRLADARRQNAEIAYQDGWSFAFRQWERTGSVPYPRPSTQERSLELRTLE